MSSSSETWTVLRILEWTSEFFESKGIEHARRNAEEIIAHVLGISRLEVYLNFEKPLNAAERKEIAELVKRRSLYEPLQYLLGSTNFRGLEIAVGPEVLIPRPETELLVEYALEMIKDIEKPRVLDLCAGSGCIALAIAHEREDATLIATDISEQALSLARQNADQHKLSDRISFLQGDLLIPRDTSFDLIVSNPPYVPSARLDSLEKQVRDFEPMLALDGGASGLDVFGRILDQLRDISQSGRNIPSCILELDESHLNTAALAAESSELFSHTHVLKDLTQRDRFLRLVRNEVNK